MNNMHMKLFGYMAMLNRKQRGLSLIEIMVAMLISMFLLGGVIQVYSSTRVSYQTNEGLSRLQENARFIFDRIAADLNSAGYMGCNDSNDRDLNGGFKVYNRLTIQGAGAGGAYDFSNPIAGVNSNGPNNSDQLFVRRSVGESAVQLATPFTQPDTVLFLDTANQSFAALEQWQTLALSDCEKTAIFMITAPPNNVTGAIAFNPGVTSPVGQINEGQSNIGTIVNTINLTDLQGDFGQDQASMATAYQVATTRYDIQASASPSGFSLFLNNVEYIEDVTDMQILFGLDADGTPGAEQFVTANNAALAAAGMNAVASMRIDLTLDATGIQVSGQALQKTFSQTFRLRNR
jgi:type IV pilus assembly protein PilW